MSILKKIQSVILGTSKEDARNTAKNDIVSLINQKLVSFKTMTADIATQEHEMPPQPEFSVPDLQPLLNNAARDFLVQEEQQENHEQLFKAFRLQHGLVELPNQPATLNTLLGLGIAVIIESFVNVAFFMKAHLVAGPIDALLTSSLISSTNVFVSASVGYFFGRWTEWGLHSPEPDHAMFQTKRTIAQKCVKAFIPVMGLFHITVAAMRSQENLDHVVHSLPEYFNILSTPESLFLMLTGACMTLLSFYKGKHGLSDPYPEYARHAADLEAIEADKRDLYETYSEEVATRFDEAEETAQEKLSQYNAEVKAFNQRINDGEAYKTQLLSDIASAQNILNAEDKQIQSLYSALGKPSDVSQSPEHDDGSSSLSDLSVMTAAIEAMTLPEPLPLATLATYQKDCETHHQAVLAALTAMMEPPNDSNTQLGVTT